MYDHIAINVPDPAAAEPTFRALLAPLAIEQTMSTPVFKGWGDFVVRGIDDEHPLTERAHIAFVAPSRDAVGAFWQAGVDAGLRDDGPPGPRPSYGDDYYGAFLRDGADNSFEAVHRSGHRTGGNVDHVALRIADLAATIEFYKSVGGAAGFDLVREAEDRATFGGGAAGGVLSVVAGPPTVAVHLAFPGDEEAVRRFHEAAVAAGGRSNGEPGERPYHPGYYAAFVLDPDGNNVEVVDHHR